MHSRDLTPPLLPLRALRSTAVVLLLALTSAAPGCATSRPGEAPREPSKPAATPPRAAPAPAPEPVKTVECFSRFDLSIDPPAEIPASDVTEVSARFLLPSGKEVQMPGFVSRGKLRVRFSPQEPGIYQYRLSAHRGAVAADIASGTFRALAGTGRGFVRVSPRFPHRLAFPNGAIFVPLGENRFNVYDPSWNYQSLEAPAYIAAMAGYGMNTIRLFVFTDCEKEEPAPGPQPGCLEPAVGRFDDSVAEQYDTILEAAERNGIYVILTAFAVGFTPKDVWKGWEDNPYSTARGGPAKTPRAFFDEPRIRELARGKLRYLSARFGAWSHLLAIDLLNEPEWDGGISENTWIPWAEEMSAAWKKLDPHGHPVMVGSVGLHWNEGGDEKRWYGSPHNDIVQWHLFGKEIYDVHALAPEMSRKIRETWSYDKPVLCGEFAYGGEAKPEYDHTHVGIWSAVFSGSGVLARSAPPFTLDSDEPMTPERGRHFATLRRFLDRLPVGTSLDPVAVKASGASAWMLSAGPERALWLFGPKRKYGSPVEGVKVALPVLPAGAWEAQWYDDVTGELLTTTRFTTGAKHSLAAPSFRKHVAAILRPAPVPPAGDKPREIPELPRTGT